MIFKTDITKIRSRSLKLRDFRSSSQIRKYCKERKLERFVYKIYHENTGLLKIGKTNYGGERGDHGERLCRQLGNVPGWPTHRKSGNGKEMIDVCDEFLRVYGYPVHKDNLIVIIYDMTKYPFALKNNPRQNVDFFEAESIEEYFESRNSLPIGNSKRELAVLKRGLYFDNVLANLFHGDLHHLKPPGAPKHKTFEYA